MPCGADASPAITLQFVYGDYLSDELHYLLAMRQPGASHQIIRLAKVAHELFETELYDNTILGRTTRYGQLCCRELPFPGFRPPVHYEP